MTETMNYEPPAADTHAAEPLRTAVLGLAIAIVLAFFTFAVAFVFPSFVDMLPRPMQGESVTVPWWLCLAASLVVPVAVPWAAVMYATRSVGWRVFVLIAAAALTWFWFSLGSVDLLAKAWRRGL